MSFKVIDPLAALEEIRANPGIQLLDVREEWEFEKAHIEGVKLIPLGELESRQCELDRSKPLICICAAGGRSERAAKLLDGLGFSDITNMSEGMKGWQARALPLDPLA